MYISQNKNNLKRNVIFISAILVVLLGGGVYAWFSSDISLVGEDKKNTTSENTVNIDEPTDEQRTSGNKAKSEFNSAHYGAGNSSSDNVSGDKKTTELLITSINQTANALTIASSIDVLDDGSCELMLTREGSEVVTAQVAAHQTSSYTACEDFNIDIAGLEKGEWNIKIDYVGGAYLGKTTGKVTIK